MDHAPKGLRNGLVWAFEMFSKALCHLRTTGKWSLVAPLHRWIVVVSALAVLILAACGGEENSYKDQMAEWHIQWNIGLSDDVKSRLITELTEIEPPWTSGTKLARHERYVLVHEQYYQTNKLNVRLMSDLWDAWSLM